MLGFFKRKTKNRKFDAKQIMAFNLTIDAIIRAGTDLLSSDDDIAEALEELEGDYVSFIHINSLIWLKDAGILDDTQISLIQILRNKIDIMPSSSWNPVSYRNNAEWIEIHAISNKILNSLGINKRQVDSEMINPIEVLNYYTSRK
jgi:hypothetical protein